MRKERKHVLIKLFHYAMCVGKNISTYQLFGSDTCLTYSDTCSAVFALSILHRDGWSTDIVSRLTCGSGSCQGLKMIPLWDRNDCD